MKNRTSLDAYESLEKPSTRQGRSRNEGKVWDIMAIEQKRKRLIDELHDIEDNLQDRLKEDYAAVLEKLDRISTRAQQNDISDINQIVHFNILRDKLRNLQMQVKQSSFTKRQVDNPFRSARIEQFDYREIEEQKLSQNSLLVYPNQWGKGFKPYCWGNGFNSEDKNDMRKIPKEREKYNFAFDYVRYIDSVKEVNRIFFDGYKDPEKSVREVVTKVQTTCVFLLVLVIIAILIIINSSQQNYMLKWILCLLGSSLFLLISFTELFITVRCYVYKPSQQTEIEYVGQQIQLYLDQMNKKINEDQKILHKYEWKCHSDLMYIEVHFPKGIPYGFQPNQII